MKSDRFYKNLVNAIAAFAMIAAGSCNRGKNNVWTTAMDLSPDGQRLAVARSDGTVTLGRTTSKEVLWTTTLAGQKGSRAVSILFLGQGDELVSSDALVKDRHFAPGGASRLTIWNAKNGIINRIDHSAGGTNALASASLSDGWRIAALDASGIAILESRKKRFNRSRIQFTQRSLCTLAFSLDARMLVGTGYDHCTVWDVKSGKQKMSVQLDGLSVFYATFTPDSKQVLLLGDTDEFIRYFDVDSGKITRRVRWFEGFRNVSVAGDRMRMASCGHDEPGAMVWNIATGERIVTLGRPANYSHVSISSDGAQVAAVRVGGVDLKDIDVWQVNGN